MHGRRQVVGNPDGLVVRNWPELGAGRTPTDQSERDLPQADDIRINDLGPVMRAAGNGIELAPMRFGFSPSSPKGGPIFNFRSEGRRFDKSYRCLIPASAFFEFTGTKYPKAKHRFTLTDAPFMAIAGLCRERDGTEPAAFTMLTTAPGPDVAPYHNRQIVVLRPEDRSAWIDLSRPESAAAPASCRRVERRDGSGGRDLTEYPRTPDGRYFVGRGASGGPAISHLSASERERLVRELMAARRAVR